MNSKKINKSILVISKALNLLIIIIFANVLAKFLWWVVSPSIIDVYVEKISVNQFENSVKYIINRYPFGAVTVAVQQAPSIIDKIKLSGVYLSSTKNSIAFLDIDNKHVIVKAGDDIADGIILKRIMEDKVIVLYQGQELAILLSGGTATAVIPQTLEKSFNPFTRNNEPIRPAFPPGGRPEETSNLVNNKASDEIRERRRQLIEEFEKQAAAEREHNRESDRQPIMERNK